MQRRSRTNRPVYTEPRLTSAAGKLILDGESWFMRAGEFQYFRIERKLWERSLGKLAALGFNSITTYVPWIWHEPTPGHYDFAGATDARRDLIGFLRACKAEGLPVIVRPGPFIYAEYEGFGHPRWLEDRIPDALLRGPGGKPVRGDFWAAYSLGHPQYRAAVRGWYETVAGQLSEFWNDPVIGWQIDNETGFLYANGLGKWDFNSDTVGRFQGWLKEQYGAVDKLNRAWETHYSDFDQIKPPKLTMRRGLTEEWQRFFEGWVQDYLGWLRDTAREVGVTVPLSHNDSANFQPPTNPGQKATSGVVDLYGFDMYIKLSGRPVPSDYPWGSACAPAYFRAITPEDKPLLCWELGAGWFDPRAHVSDAAFLQSVFGELAHGLKGASLYVAQDGVEANGEPYTYNTVLDAAGKPGPRYEVTGRVMEFIRQHEAELLSSRAEPSGPVVGFAFHFPDFRFRADDYLPLIGLQDPPRILALVLAHFGIFAAITAAGYGPNLRMINLDTATASEIASCQAIVMPSRGSLAAETYSLLRHYVENGGHLITTGRPAAHDLIGRPLDTGELYPHVHAFPASKTRFLGRIPMMVSLAKNWMGKYLLLERRGLRKRHKTSMHIIDLAEPLLSLMHAPQSGATLTTPAGTEVRGDFLVTHFGGRGRVLLRERKRVAGYAVEVGEGSSSVIGSQPGGSYFTPQYYRLTVAERDGIRRFWRDILSGVGAPPAVEIMDELEIEVQLRTTDTGQLLYILNRLPKAQCGRIRITDKAVTIVQLFSGKSSKIEALADGMIEVDLEPADLVVARLVNA